MGKYVLKRGRHGRNRRLNEVRVSYGQGNLEKKSCSGTGDPLSPNLSPSSTSVNRHVRPSSSIATLVGSRQNTLPYKLRVSVTAGGATTTSGKANVASVQNETAFPVISGYRVVSLHKMQNCINVFLSEHNEVSPLCVPQIHFVSEREILNGMCAAEVITCTTCHFTSGLNHLYSQVATSVPGQRGRKAGDLNTRLALGMLNTGVGVREVRELFAILDLPVPSASSLQSTCNKIADKLETLGAKVMSENRQKVKTVMDIWNEKELIVESDTSYNNSIKGRSFYQPGTQAFCPLIEQVTPKKLIIAHNIKNKLCRRCQLYGKNHANTCTANYPKYEPIGNAEMALAKDNMDDLLNDASGLKPSIVVTDNDGKIVKGMNAALKAKFPMETIVKEDCAIHVSRGQRRKCASQAWSEDFAGKKGTSVRKRFIMDLTNVVVKRCAGEMNGIKLNASTKDFATTVDQAKQTIISCFKGDHTKCKMSYVCPAHINRTPHARHLPGKQFLHNMTVSDEKHLQNVIDYKLSFTMATRQKHLASTNKSEAIHNKIFRAVPKSKTFSRNVSGRASTQIIASSLGKDIGITRSCSVSQTPLSKHGPGQKILTELHKRDLYTQLWRTRPDTKRRRKQTDCQRKNKSRARGSLYSSDHLHPTVSAEHDYAQNIS